MDNFYIQKEQSIKKKREQLLKELDYLGIEPKTNKIKELKALLRQEKNRQK